MSESVPLQVDGDIWSTSNQFDTDYLGNLLLYISDPALGGHPEISPRKGQVVVENLVGGLRDLPLPIVGKVFSNISTTHRLVYFHHDSQLEWFDSGVGVFGFYDDHGHLKY